MTPEEFIQWLAPSAVAQCKPYNLPPSVVIAQAALESGWGKYTIGEYNLFGRKWGGWGRYIEKATQEYWGGEYHTIIDKFQDYDSLLEAIDDWCILITQEPAYLPAWGIWCATGDVEQFVYALGPVYATDPEYEQKLMATIRANDLLQYDSEVV